MEISTRCKAPPSEHSVPLLPALWDRLSFSNTLCYLLSPVIQYRPFLWSLFDEEKAEIPHGESMVNNNKRWPSSQCFLPALIVPFSHVDRGSSEGQGRGNLDTEPLILKDMEG